MKAINIIFVIMTIAGMLMVFAGFIFDSAHWYWSGLLLWALEWALLNFTKKA